MRRALVTGGTRGIGLAICRELARTHEVVATYAHDDAAAQACGIPSVKCDVTSSAAVEAFFKEQQDFDVLVHAAGFTRDKLMMMMPERDFDDVLAVHLKGAFNCSRHAAPLMKDQGYGRIINISSSAGLRGNFGQTNYGAAKAAMMGLTFIWSMELGRYGVTVNAVAPAGGTRMTASLYERSGRTEVPPEQDPSLNAPLVTFLASERAAHVNGQILGRTDYAFTLFQHPKQVAWMWRDGGWTPELVAEYFDQMLGQHLQHVGMVMPTGMEHQGSGS